MSAIEWTMWKLTEVSTGYWASAALNAAVTLGIFDVIAAGEMDADELARRTGCSGRHMARLLSALAGLGVLEQRGMKFALCESAREYLSPGGKACLLDGLQFNGDLYQIWGKLADCVRNGRPVVPPTAHLGLDPERTRRFVKGMHSRALGIAPVLLPWVKVPDSGTLLDVGAGPGTLSRLLAEKNAGLDITLFDMEPVLAVARELGAGSLASGRIKYVPGDYRRDPLPGGFDAVLFCGTLHQEDPSSARAVLGKIYASLKDGGQVWVIDFMLDDDGSNPAFAALFSINMMLTSPCGRVYPVREVMEMVFGLGMKDVESMSPAGCPYRIVKGRKY